VIIECVVYFLGGGPHVTARREAASAGSRAVLHALRLTASTVTDPRNPLMADAQRATANPEGPGSWHPTNGRPACVPAPPATPVAGATSTTVT
jgi:hypothetical protein